MKEFIDIFIENKDKIENYISESIKNLGSLSRYVNSDYKDIYETFISLELIYVVDANTKIQTSANIYRNSKDEKQRNKSREYLFPKMHLKGKDFFVTSPYRSSATRSTCITVVKQEGDEIIFMDFDLVKMLERLGLVELNLFFNKVTKSFYLFAGSSLAVLAIFIIGYAVVDFAKNFLFEFNFNIETIFKPIIALTLGVAIFDLAKTILEQEYFFKSYSKNSKIETKVLTKFLITIIIALSIEALMVVFKIAIEDYDKMINALYLIMGISMIILSLAVFNYLTKKNK